MEIFVYNAGSSSRRLLDCIYKQNYGWEMAETLATNTNREETFLQTYFNGLAQSSFDKCKDVVVGCFIFKILNSMLSV